MHISLAAEPIFYFLGMPITNSLLTTWLVMVFLIIITLIVKRKMNLVPDGVQNLLEEIVQVFLNLTEAVVGERARTFFPLVFTFFLFILVSNWFGLLPLVGSWGIRETLHEKETFIPFLRPATADLNTTLALALVAIFSIQYYGVKSLNLAYFKKFVNLTDPINFFVGVLELISEFSKIISFSFRLFGNIFAGEVLLMVIAFLVPVLAPLPFFGLELFVGFIQALVFAMLTLVFLNVATVKNEEHE